MLAEPLESQQLCKEMLFQQYMRNAQHLNDASRPVTTIEMPTTKVQEHRIFLLEVEYVWLDAGLIESNT
eukprot:1596122-Amphidinium_carterae.2